MLGAYLGSRRQKPQKYSFFFFKNTEPQNQPFFVPQTQNNGFSQMQKYHIGISFLSKWSISSTKIRNTHNKSLYFILSKLSLAYPFSFKHSRV